jgi:hypothetical protein
VVDHVHFHGPRLLLISPREERVDADGASTVIPKPGVTDKAGLVIGWPTHEADKGELAALAEELKGKL